MQSKPAATVPKGATINLAFDSEPEEVTANEILSEEDFRKINVKNKKIIARKQKVIILFLFIQHGLMIEPQNTP